MELFREPDAYDDMVFPEFSNRKRNLKQTEEGRLELSTEVQMVMDKIREDSREEGRKETLVASIKNIMKSLQCS